ncbi:hypothetical protein E1B28_009402 [Marasmius oreades]|uniref:Uncharacterized protein n=1 Tax=Marasmius oreades TaxID=181124 RepID=A0A9P7S0J6_9AGAR|nr:uncharacterized protein E1B28_009402 [Marasmius oreades]KAG7093117.1 hypothetical protein E1B28_009402 [Marasmius oreades]
MLSLQHSSLEVIENHTNRTTIMKFTSLVSIVSLAAVASAWHLQLYDGELYQGLIHDRSGTLSQPCADLDASADNKASSMHWEAGTFAGEIILFEKHGCVAEVGRSDGDWSLAQFSSFANNKVSSYKIN